MKMTMKITAALAAALGLAACDRFLVDDISTTPKPRKDIVLTKAQSDILPATREFTFDFMREVCASGNDNVFLSPFSLQTALSMASAGADGQTREEINRAIGLEDFSTED